MTSLRLVGEYLGVYVLVVALPGFLIGTYLDGWWELPPLWGAAAIAAFVASSTVSRRHPL